MKIMGKKIKKGEIFFFDLKKKGEIFFFDQPKNF